MSTIQKIEKYRFVVRQIKIGFLKKKNVIIIQKKIRGMVYPGYIEDIWVDCSANEISNVTMEILNG